MGRIPAPGRCGQTEIQLPGFFRPSWGEGGVRQGPQLRQSKRVWEPLFHFPGWTLVVYLPAALAPLIIMPGHGVEHMTQATTNQYLAFLGHADWLQKGPVTNACPIRMILSTVRGVCRKQAPPLFHRLSLGPVRGVGVATDTSPSGEEPEGFEDTTLPPARPTNPQVPSWLQLDESGLQILEAPGVLQGHLRQARGPWAAARPPGIQTPPKSGVLEAMGPCPSLPSPMEERAPGQHQGQPGG